LKLTVCLVGNNKKEDDENVEQLEDENKVRSRPNSTFLSIATTLAKKDIC
jgi:hypothetical protein